MSAEGPCATHGLIGLLPAAFVGQVLNGSVPADCVLAETLQYVTDAVASPTKPAAKIAAHLESVRDAVRKDPTASAESAARGFRAREPVAALAHYTDAIRLNPSEDTDHAAILHTHRAAALAAVGQNGAAVADAREAVMLAPLYAKGWACYAASVEMPATGSREQSLWAKPDGELFRTLAQRLCQAADPETAGDAETEALQLAAKWRGQARKISRGSAEKAFSSCQLPGGAKLYREGKSRLAGAGRCLNAAAAVNAGTTVLSELPLASARRRELAPTEISTCDWCYRPALAALPCAGCSDVLYCDRRCRAGERERHPQHPHHPHHQYHPPTTDAISVISHSVHSRFP
jgi:hypothetical protein